MEINSNESNFPEAVEMNNMQFPPPPTQMSYPAPESPLKCKIDNNIVLCLLILAVCAIPSLFSLVLTALTPETELTATYISYIFSFLTVILRIGIKMFIGKYIYKSLVGAVVFTGLMGIAGSVSSAIADGIVSPLFLFTNEISTFTTLEVSFSIVLDVAFSVVIVLLFNSLMKKEEYEADITERLTKNPVSFMIIAFLVSTLVASVPSSIVGTLSGFVIVDSFDSTMPMQAINYVLPVITAFCSLLQIVIYYFFIKRAYCTKKRVLALIALPYFATAVSTPFLNLCSVAKGLLEVFTATDPTVLTLMFSSLISFLTFALNIIFIAVSTKKFEPEIRKI